MQDLEREGLDVGIRYCTDDIAGPHAVRLFGERVFPVCSPALAADPKRPLREPADLRHHVLLQYDDPEGYAPWLNWKSWLELFGLADLRPAGSILLSGYEHIIPAAIAGQGVALGRMTLADQYIREKRLVALFGQAQSVGRAFHAVVSKEAEGRPEVKQFVAWVKRELKPA